jgi:uncharacterized radical SAM superfamily Fe-S cluster-containing enzyme
VHAGGGAENGGEKRHVSVLLPAAIDLALRSNMQRRVDVLQVYQTPIVQGVAATPITVVGDAEVMLRSKTRLRLPGPVNSCGSPRHRAVGPRLP